MIRVVLRTACTAVVLTTATFGAALTSNGMARASITDHPVQKLQGFTGSCFAYQAAERLLIQKGQVLFNEFWTDLYQTLTLMS